MPTFVLIGHCGPDSHLLRNAISRAVPGATIVDADDDAALKPHLRPGNVLLINRVLDGSDFDTDSGIDLIESLAQRSAGPALMLISNYAEAQAAALAAGAVQGFGKKQVNAAHSAELLRAAAAAVDAASAERSKSPAHRR